MNKRKLTRSLMAAFSIVAITAVMYGCGGGGGGGDAEAPATDMSDMDAALGAAQTAAATAATAAGIAAGAAHTAVMGQSGNQAADEGSYAVAQNAAMRARAAADAAQAASAAAAATMDADEAKAQQAIAEAKQTEAETEQGNAEMYAGMVADAQQAIDDAAEEAADLAAAKTAAMTAATTARMAADDAQTAADRVAELTGAGSMQAVAAQEAADAADTAADAAEAANGLAQDAMDSGIAEGHQATAETEQGKAAAQLAMATELQREAQVASDVGDEQQEARDIAAAQDAASDAAAAARGSYGDAMADASAARTRATAARAAADRAALARTDAVNADKHATAAEAAADAAEAAATAAMMAMEQANTANTNAMGATTADGAEMYQGQAETASGTASAQAGTANTQSGIADTAASSAEESEGMHVVGLLQMANADHINTAPVDPANTEADEAKAIAENKAAHVAMVNMAVETAANAADHGGGEVAATYPYGTDGDGVPAIAVTGTGIDDAQLVHADAEADPAVKANFGLGMGLGDFPHEKYLTGRDTSDQSTTGTRVILFTDLEQASAPTEGSSDAVDNAAVSMAARVDITGALVDATGDTPRNFPGMYDHDGDPATPAFTGTFTCADPLTCTVNLTDTNADGDYQEGTEVGSIANYRFTGTRTIAPMDSMPDTTWLAFGVWLTETEEEGVNTYAFGAFADGGDVVEDADNIEEVTGTATYEGSAAGVHSTASEVEFFSADATLMADFGDGAGNGTITGEIHNIVSGGVPLADGPDNKIFLYVSDLDTAGNTTSNIDDDGSFDGRTRMGAGEFGSDGELDYPYNGTWSGNFYNHMANVEATNPLMENTRAPGSVAGTFGVGRADDDDTMDVDETKSYVGAFGAHCSGSNCNPHD